MNQSILEKCNINIKDNNIFNKLSAKTKTKLFKD